MNNSLIGHKSGIQVIKFCLPAILMTLITTLYTVLDGMFVSRLISTDALAAVNISYPLYGFILGLSIMVGSGGSAIVIKKYGNNDLIGAKKTFTLLFIFSFILNLIVIVFLFIFLKELLYLLGCNKELYSMCFNYSKTLLIFLPFSSIQTILQYYYVVNNKASFGLKLTILSGVINVILDYILIKYTSLNVMGASIATGIAIFIPSIISLGYFIYNKELHITFLKPKFNFNEIKQCIINGSSEMINFVSYSVIVILYNKFIFKYLGNDGISAVAVILYLQYLINCLVTGFSNGVSPLFSYNYGAKNHILIKDLFKKCIMIIFIISTTSFLIALLFFPTLAKIFTSSTSNVYQIIKSNYHYVMFAFLFSGMNIFSAAFFTSLSNGITSAIISIFRSLISVILSITILDLIFKQTGVFLSLSVSELLTFILSITFILSNTKYFKEIYYKKPNIS